MNLQILPNYFKITWRSLFRSPCAGLRFVCVCRGLRGALLFSRSQAHSGSHSLLGGAFRVGDLSFDGGKGRFSRCAARLGGVGFSGRRRARHHGFPRRQGHPRSLVERRLVLREARVRDV